MTNSISKLQETVTKLEKKVTKIDDMFAYIFDPYYLEEDYYSTDGDVAIILHESFSHNRLVKIERLFDENKRDFSLLNKKNRFAIVISR